MVNLKKIGAVATGALFVGATLGMATAITVPNAFNPDMLAQNGVAKAQLVVGANAPGKAADEESADIIKNAVKSKLAVAGLGGDLNFAFGSQDLDDDDGLADFFARSSNGSNMNGSTFFTTSSGSQGSIIYYTMSTGAGGDTGLWYDANDNGNLGDSSDYILYNGFYVIDDNVVQPVLDLVTDTRIYQSADSTNGNWGNSEEDTFGTGKGWLGGVFKIKGNKYVLTKEVSSYEAQIASAKIVTLANKGTSGNLKDYAASVFGGKLAWQDGGNATDTDGTLFIMDADGNSEKTITIDLAGATTSDVYTNTTANLYPTANPKLLPGNGMVKASAVSGTSFAGYKIFLKAQPDNTTIKVIVGKEGEFTLSNNMDNAMGYNRLYMSMGAGVVNPDFSLLADNQFHLMGPAVNLVPGETVDIPDTDYQVKLDITKLATPKRKKSVSISSGTKMKTSHPDYGDFLSTDTTVTAGGAGGPAEEPVLEVVDDSAASSSMNQVLLGGHIANEIVASLVTSGDSEVAWETSDGDVEVINDKPAAGKYTIIVAGADRDKTKAAAEALADAL